VASEAAWTFLSNHAHVLICVSADPRARISDIAERVGITYRGVQRILSELEAAGYLSRARAEDDARSNVYEVNGALPLRHPLERHRRVAALLELGRREGGGAEGKRPG
jgi:DNA-binding Lrp family transcriptional regulator